LVEREDLKFFRTAKALRAWFEKNHDKVRVLQIGFYKKHVGKPGVTYPEAVGEALCFGWIDGVRHSIDAECYTNRFTPRKPRSPWSRINIARVAELKKQGLMHPAGLAAFESRDTNRDTAYAREEGMGELSPEYIRVLKKNKRALTNWNALPPSYRRVASWWVMSAKREETREKRLTTLIEDSANNRRIALVTPTAKKAARAR
jgi:uncharacterized protein YdeI (YjbR/CyaY-like superfamily)